MTDDYDRRIGALEDDMGNIRTDMTEVEKCIVRLEAHEEDAVKHRDKVEETLWKNGDTAVVPTMGRIEDTVAYLAVAEQAQKDDKGSVVTWKDIGKGLVLPLVVGFTMLLAGLLLGSGA